MADDGKCVREVRRSGQTTVVVLAGAVDMHHAPLVLRTLLEAIQGTTSRLVVNFEAVNYMDSSGLATLVEVYRRMKAASGQLVLCGVNERVRSIFELTKLDRFFTICANEEEALAR